MSIYTSLICPICQSELTISTAFDFEDHIRITCTRETECEYYKIIELNKLEIKILKSIVNKINRRVTNNKEKKEKLTEKDVIDLTNDLKKNYNKKN